MARPDARAPKTAAPLERAVRAETVKHYAETIFYIQTRGVSADEARRLVVEAFFEEVLEKIPVEAIRDSVWRTVQRKLGREIGRDDRPAGADAWQAG